jgi:hypothetical protein
MGAVLGSQFHDFTQCRQAVVYVVRLGFGFGKGYLLLFGFLSLFLFLESLLN